MWQTYLEPIALPPAPPVAPGNPPVVHLSTSMPVLRRNPWGHAFPLSEPDRPTRQGADAAARAGSLLGIIRWLGVEKHARYRPTASTTYCNVYAYDYCQLAGVYLPRVWWLPAALKAIAAGQKVDAIYGRTVGELSANALYRWLAAWGHAYGWTRLGSLDEAQDAANRGEVAVICARRKVESMSGHISVVAPESASLSAERDVGGKVTLPIQSQAGGRLIEYGRGTPWWKGAEFAEWGVWRCSRAGLASE